ncbi:hypothetical protein C1702_00245 [Caldimonas thermodepolymerans]|uniref:Uncharacterized protein n=1 Tax=Caldimonas thermodepolymerans TaxID=215580 RepID=A0A2S5T933_9BURK|nr:hypothetical protein C1702_00245 [Caldimonas thermodepolymerans]RDI02918.1 hypothetical protein DES46_102346 [Caldimonas thermodepolymerans]
MTKFFNVSKLNYTILSFAMCVSLGSLHGCTTPPRPAWELPPLPAHLAAKPQPLKTLPARPAPTY